MITKFSRFQVKDLIGHDDEFAIKMDDADTKDVSLSGNTIISVKRTVKAANGGEMMEEEGAGKKKKRKSEGGEKVKKRKSEGGEKVKKRKSEGGDKKRKAKL